MITSIDQMPESSRLWIYQADRRLETEEIEFVGTATQQFLKDWTAHGSELKASYTIAHNQFLVITLDEGPSQASGCSIDASVGLVKELENKLAVSFMNNSKVAFLIENEIELLPFNNLKQKVAEQVVRPDTKVFNNTITNLGEFRSKWLVESEKTWINRFF